jgi:hypothetical protein
MVKFWAQLGVSVVTVTTYTAVTGSPWAPPVNGRIKKLRLIFAGDAATSLIERTDVKLKCTTFGGVDCEISGSDTGLRTVPANAHNQSPDYDVDLPIKTGSNVTVEAKNNVTATTPNTAIMALIEA